MLNCFKTEKNGIIICFCDYYKNNENYYYIAAYNQDLEYLCNYTQKINIYKDIDTFIYSIGLKDDIGAFIYFENDRKPKIFFKGYDNSNNCFKDFFEQIKLDHLNFYSARKTNDFIKISNDKICLISSYERKIIYIVIINLFNNNGSESSYHIKIRYYSINLKLLNFELEGGLKAYIFNDFIALSAGYFFDYDNNFLNYYLNSLMIIGYSNKTDSNFDIIDYIIKEKCPITNLKIDLVEDMTIDNNIFGYKYKSIKYMII